MRPLKLNMTAFGAYAESVALDFETGLNGNNFFLIHGATGAGKTTILDGICYALYGKTSGDDRKVDMMRSDQAAVNRKTEVEFEFSLNDKIYTVYRSQNFNGKENAAEVYVNGALKTGGLRNVNEYIKSQIGFNDEQFRQVVILPQGNFRKFLSANARAKADLLNSIFDANMYKLVEETLKDRFKTAKNIYDELTAKNNFLLNEARKFGDIASERDIPALIEMIRVKLNAAVRLREESDIKLRDEQNNLSVALLLNEDFSNLDTAVKNLQAVKNTLAKITADLNPAQVEFDRRKAEEAVRRDVDNRIAKLNEIQAAIAEFNRQRDALTKAEADEKNAKYNLDKLDAEYKRSTKLLDKLRQDEKSLRNIDAEFVKAEKVLQDAKDRDACVKEIAQLQDNLTAANKTLANADTNYKSVNVELERLRLLQKNGTAARLATTLNDGEPCPVCGATIHPQPAVSADIIPTDDEISRAEQLLKRRQGEKDTAANVVARIGGELNTKQESLKKFAGVSELAEVKKLFEAAKESVRKLKEIRQRVKNGEGYIEKKSAELEAARRDSDVKSKAAANLRGIVDEKRRQIPQEYSDNPQKLTQDLTTLQKSKRELDAAWKSAEENFHRLDNQKSAQEGKLQAAEKAVSDATAKVAGKPKPNIAELKSKADAAQKSKDESVAAVTTLNNNLSHLQTIFDEIQQLALRIGTADKDLRVWQQLSNVADGRITFQRYYLDAMFQGVIVEANARLDKMSSGRFQFRGNKNALDKHLLEGLSLEILDAYTGKARPVETLSGGESFLASLSLALGLAAVVQQNAGGIKLDTIFIDEGFGTLDSETLDNAINTLSELQDGGRLVGIISHVDELKNRIPVRLEVVKTKLGSTAKFVS